MSLTCPGSGVPPRAGDTLRWTERISTKPWNRDPQGCSGCSGVRWLSKKFRSRCQNWHVLKNMKGPFQPHSSFKAHATAYCCLKATTDSSPQLLPTMEEVPFSIHLWLPFWTFLEWRREADLHLGMFSVTLDIFACPPLGKHLVSDISNAVIVESHTMRTNLRPWTWGHVAIAFL